MHFICATEAISAPDATVIRRFFVFLLAVERRE